MEVRRHPGHAGVEQVDLLAEGGSQQSVGGVVIIPEEDGI